MACPRCEARGKIWNGGDPECAFPDLRQFKSDNWNCATVNELRNLCGEGWPHIKQTDHAIFVRNDDLSWAAIDLIGVELERDHYKTLWLSWYKHRGRTDKALLLSDYGEPEVPTYDDCDAILNHYGARTETAQKTRTIN